MGSRMATPRALEGRAPPCLTPSASRRRNGACPQPTRSPRKVPAKHLPVRSASPQASRRSVAAPPTSQVTVPEIRPGVRRNRGMNVRGWACPEAKGSYLCPGPPARRGTDSSIHDPNPNRRPGMPGQRQRHSTAVDPQPENLDLGADLSACAGGITPSPAGPVPPGCRGRNGPQPTVEGQVHGRPPWV